MALKKLAQFRTFEIEAFMEGKDLRVVGSEPWQEYEDGKVSKIIGTKYKAVIMTDNTDYGNDTKDLNAGEQLVIKVLGAEKGFNKFDRIVMKDAEAKVFGEYSNQLSITAKDVVFQGKSS